MATIEKGRAASAAALGCREIYFRALPPTDKEYEEITDPAVIAEWKERFERQIEDVKRITASHAAFDEWRLQRLRAEEGVTRRIMYHPTFEEMMIYLRILETQCCIPGLAERLFSVKVK
jgi:hypothetical protein